MRIRPIAVCAENAIPTSLIRRFTHAPGGSALRTCPGAALLLALFSTGLSSGCSGVGASKDAGAETDGSDDTDAMLGGQLPRRDARVDGDPVPPCDRFDLQSCGVGQACILVIRRAPMEDQFSIYAGCVEAGNQRAEGDPCVPWGEDLYNAPGLSDEIFVDPCDTGLHCAPDPTIRNHFSCQASCERGLTQCAPGQFCLGPGPLQEVCNESNRCDPLNQVGCAAGEGCYLRLGDQGQSVLSVCLDAPTDPIADGEACGFLNECAPGSSCFGPSDRPPTTWLNADYVCRTSCGGALVADAGSDLDGGADEDDGGTTSPGPSGCGAGLSCNPLSGAGLDLSAVPIEIGQCEP